MKKLPRTVIGLGLVSLLTDFSSEMIYPLLSTFLVSLGATGVFIGLVEGIADATAALVKLASGAWADRRAHKKPLVVLGYSIASALRPLVALATAPWHVLAIRFGDRVGKGIRTSPRDAMIAQATPPDRRGAAYGFHRAMDHAGALVGPLAAYALLHFAGVSHRTIFALAAIPAAAALVVLLAAVREPREPVPAAAAAPAADPGAPADPQARPRLPRPLYVYLALVGVFTLANASDQFLFLRARERGVALALLPVLWALHHAVKSLLATPLGALSDRLGRKRVIVAGWIVYAVAYAGFAFASAGWHIWALFVVYGAHFALTEGAEKALVADHAPAALRGRAFGAFHFVVGVAALPASLGFGLIWQHVGHRQAFLTSAGLALGAALALQLLLRPHRPGR